MSGDRIQNKNSYHTNIFKIRTIAIPITPRTLGLVKVVKVRVRAALAMKAGVGVRAALAIKSRTSSPESKIEFAIRITILIKTRFRQYRN